MEELDFFSRRNLMRQGFMQPGRNSDAIDLEIANNLSSGICKETNVSEYWINNRHTFKILFQVSREILGIPATSAIGERQFKKSKNVMKISHRLKSELLRKRVFVKVNSPYLD